MRLVLRVWMPNISARRRRCASQTSLPSDLPAQGASLIDNKNFALSISKVLSALFLADFEVGSVLYNGSFIRISAFRGCFCLAAIYVCIFLLEMF